jgi:hypothetical protein
MDCKGQQLHCVACWGTINVAMISEKKVLIFIWSRIPGFDLSQNGKITCVLYGVT